jgi:hypothetical protein
MSIVTAKEIWCDICSEWVRLQYKNIEPEWRELRKEGWTREHGQHFCPLCSARKKLETIKFK